MKKCALFCGGYSSEHDISLKSAQNIYAKFPKEYEAIKVIVKKHGWKVLYKEKEFDFHFQNPGFYYNSTFLKFDFAFIFIHGNPGENGKIQGYLDLFNVPYINSNALTSSLSFDKWYCNNYLKALGISVANAAAVRKNTTYNAEELLETIGLPMFVKPSDSGSSYGISKVKEENDLVPALDFAFKEGDTVVLESFLNGREITCAVYQNKKGIQTLPLTEIVSENEFFDFDAKYNGKSNEITPARIDSHHENLIRSLAIRVYELLELRSFVRIDFMLVGDTPHVIEVNTIPGFSNESIVPKMLKEANIESEFFLKEIIEFELQGSHSI